MKQKLKENKYQIIELILICITAFLFNLLCNEVTYDEVWNYGFAHNIANGLIPYKDFNMVITPLFPFINAIFLCLFGDNLIVFYIINAITCTCIFYYMKKMSPNCYYAYAFLLSYAYPTYNLFCVLLLLILIDLEKNKKYDYLIGIVLGLTFLTKQNIGIYLCIPTLFIKDKKRIFKRIIGFLIPTTIFLIYLLLTKTLYQFIDYAFLGLGSFVEKNTVIYNLYFFITIITIIILIYKYIKTKDLTIIYLLCFQGMAFPLVESYHVIIAFIPALCYILKDIKIHKKLLTSAFVIFLILVFGINTSFYYKGYYNFPNTTNVFKYRKMSTETALSVNNLSNYVKENEGKTYIIDPFAYLIKIEASQELTKYDLLNDGNLGANGEMKIIEEFKTICNKEKCTFLINPQEIGNPDSSQTNQDIIDYIINNYTLKEYLGNLAVFKNY